MKNPKVSVIMSVYNSDKFLSESIESILNQTFRDFEFIIINDCSTDKSLDIIKKYSKNDNRIVLIENENNIGLTKSLNKGVKIAKGNYIARIDADDTALNNRFEVQYNFLEKNKNIFLVGGGTYEIDYKGKIIRRFLRITNSYLLKKRLIKKNCIYHSSIFFRNEKIYYRDKFIYSQDYDFFLILISMGKKLSNIQKPLIKYRISLGAISWSKFIKQQMFAEKAKEFYQQRLKYGKDEYDEFNENDILNLENIPEKINLEKDMIIAKKIQDKDKFFIAFSKYAKKYGFFNRFLVYYITRKLF